MVYFAPSLEELKKSAEKMRSDYTKSKQSSFFACKPDSSRIKTTQLFQTIAQSLKNSEEDKQTLLGLYILNYEQIYALNSSLSAVLAKDLKITRSNSLDSYTKITSLTALYHYIEKQNSQTHFAGYDGDKYDNSKNKFLNAVKLQLKTAIAAAKPELDPLFQRRPSAEALFKSFSELPAFYDESKKKTNDSREIHLQFLRAVDEQCRINNLDNVYLTNSGQNLIREQSLGYILRYSSVMYVMSQIEDEYSLLSAERSELYRQCQKAINLSKTQNINPFLRYTYYATLYGLIPKIDPTKEESCEWTTENFPYANAFFDDMDEKLLLKLKQTKKDVKEQDQLPLLNSIRKSVNTGAGLALSVGLGTLAVSAADIPVGKFAISKLGGYLGRRAGYGFLGAKAGEQIGNTIERGIVSASVCKSATYATNRTKYLSQVPGEVVYRPLNYLYKGVKKLNDLIFGKKTASRCESPECIDSLLSLPDDVYSADLKARLRNIELHRPIPVETAEPTNNNNTLPAEVEENNINSYRP